MNIILLFEVQVKEWISEPPSQLMYATYAIAKRKSGEKRQTFKSENHDEGRGWGLLKFYWCITSTGCDFRAALKNYVPQFLPCNFS